MFLFVVGSAEITNHPELDKAMYYIYVPSILFVLCFCIMIVLSFKNINSFLMSSFLLCFNILYIILSYLQNKNNKIEQNLKSVQEEYTNVFFAKDAIQKMYYWNQGSDSASIVCPLLNLCNVIKSVQNFNDLKLVINIFDQNTNLPSISEKTIDFLETHPLSDYLLFPFKLKLQNKLFSSTANDIIDAQYIYKVFQKYNNLTLKNKLVKLSDLSYINKNVKYQKYNEIELYTIIRDETKIQVIKSQFDFIIVEIYQNAQLIDKFFLLDYSPLYHIGEYYYMPTKSGSLVFEMDKTSKKLIYKGISFFDNFNMNSVLYHTNKYINCNIECNFNSNISIKIEGQDLLDLR